MNYREHLKSKKWTKKKNRLKEMNFFGKKCDVCFKEITDTHHKTYNRLGNESDNDLVFLCRYHHFQAHDFCKENGYDLYTGTNIYIKENRKKF